MWFDWSPSLTVTQLIRLYSFGLASKMHKLKNRPKDQRKNLTFHQTGGVNQGNLWSSAISAFSWSYKKKIQSHSIKFYVTFSRDYTVSLAMRAFSCFSSYTQKYTLDSDNLQWLPRERPNKSRVHRCSPYRCLLPVIFRILVSLPE